MIKSTTEASPHGEFSRGPGSFAAFRARGAHWVGRAILALFAIGVASAICLVTGLIPGWGRWYASNLAYRRQTEAMLHGSLALDDDPRTLGYDMAWAEGGIQQVWGLGVPSWRLPFELIAKLFGYAAFPDRLALAAALALLVYALFRLLVFPPGANPVTQIKRRPEALAGVLLLILFPPLLALCRTKFDVYEEAQAYMYFAALALFAATLSFLRRPTLTRYVILAAFSGLAAFVRPTLFCYGLASMFVAWMFMHRQDRRHAQSLIGLGVFCAAGGLLFLTNAIRFGSGFEFGHQLNVNVFYPMIYATRFANPVLDAPLSTRVTELFSYLFLVRDNLHCCDGYASGIFPGQAPVTRWRDIYFSTYDLTFLAFIVPAWAASLVIWWRRRAKPSEHIGEVALMGIWSLVSAAPLVVLYLNYPTMSSRYMMDFAPAFAVALWVSLHLLCQLARARYPQQPAIVIALLLTVSVWWVYQIVTTRIFPDTGGGAVAQINLGNPPNSPLVIDTSAYARATKNDFGIPFNGYGWKHPNGRTASIVVLFLPGVERLELELTPVNKARVTQKDWDRVRVKVGLEELKLKSVAPSAEGRTLIFERDSPPPDPSRIEVAFIALPSAKESGRKSKFRLERVSWSETTDE